MITIAQQSSGAFLHCPYDLVPVAYNDLEGWSEDAMDDAFKAFQHSIRYLKQSGVSRLGWAKGSFNWGAFIENLLKYNTLDTREFKDLLVQQFEVHELVSKTGEAGLFTGYFEPVYEGRLSREAGFDVPVYKRPADLILIEDLGIFSDELKSKRIGGVIEGGRLKPYYSRSEIYKGALDGKGLEIVWLKNKIDAYFLAVQGSGTIQLKEGQSIRLRYGGTNGYQYSSVGQWLVAKGEIRGADIGMESLRHWLQAHPERQDEVFSINKSFVFFEKLEGEGPVGALGCPLTTLRSLAVDPAHIPLGLPLWVKTKSLNGQTKEFSRFMLAQDTGGAIKGPLRGDVFCGTGEEAGKLAGSMQLENKIYIFLPKGFSL